MSCLEKLDRDELLALIMLRGVMISEEDVLYAQFVVANGRCVAATEKWRASLTALEKAQPPQTLAGFQKDRDARRKARAAWERTCQRADKAMAALDAYRSRGVNK